MAEINASNVALTKRNGLGRQSRVPPFRDHFITSFGGNTYWTPEIDLAGVSALASPLHDLGWQGSG